MELVFWLAIGLLAHTYLLYPLCLVAIGRLTQRPAPPAAAPEEELPPVAVVIAACNEERHIEARIRNLLALDYPPDRLAIYVGSDGSTDRTAALAEVLASSRVHVFIFDERRGKVSVLNDLLAEVDEPIVVFTDANTEFEPVAVRTLVRHFADPAVGAVCGELRLRATGPDDRQEVRYWRMETALKLGESMIGALLGANGAVYAIRRELYPTLPADTLVDDFAIAMHVSVRGRRTVFEPRARAFEDAPAGIDAEFHRRVRIGIGNYQVFFRHAHYWTRASWVARFTYFSHKVLRWFSPHLLIVALLTSFALEPHPLYSTLFDLQIGGYGLLVGGMWLRRYLRLPGVVAAPVFVFAINVAFLVAFGLYVTGRFSAQWSPRGAEATVPRRWTRAGRD